MINRVGIRVLIIIFWVVVFSALLFVGQIHWPWTTAPEINVSVWSDLFDQRKIKEFEDRTGIKVNLSFHESNEELLVKLKTLKGGGYDVIVPSDYMVEILIKEKLLKKIDTSRIAAFNKIDPLLLGHFFDPRNEYVIPYEWALVGIGIDKNYFGGVAPEPSWRLAFDKNVAPSAISMVNDPREAVAMASYYQFGPIEKLNAEQAEEVKHLLIEQKGWVKAYSDFRADYLLSTKNCPAVVTTSSYMRRLVMENKEFDFLIPHEGAFITIEHLAVPIQSDKDELVYAFLNYLFESEFIEHHLQRTTFFPAVLSAVDESTVMPSVLALLKQRDIFFKKINFFRMLVSEEQLNDIWITVKSS